MIPKTVSTHNIHFSNHLPFVLIAGPCQMESRDHAMMMAEKLVRITQDLDIPFVYKTSFDKANRTSISGQRGFGLEKSLAVFAEIKTTFGCPVLTDVHNEAQCTQLAAHVDILQIPAFLCRQTDMLLAAAKTGCVINVKKGQFLAPWDMKNVAAKIEAGGNSKILLTERGVSFGYNTLVNDFRALPIMAETCYPVIFDATHSVQQPGGQGTSSGGDRRFVPPLARAAAAVGVAGIFMETHQDPDNAPSDGANMVVISELASLLKSIKEIDRLTKQRAK